MYAERLSLSLGLLWASLAGCGGPARSAPEEAPTPDARGAVSGEDIERTPGQTIEEILMSRFPGVVVTRAPDGGVAIRIRGTTSLRGSTEPLYVIDGLAIRPGPAGSLAGVNPYDIESIEVLKDAAATTMYGVRGANGVVVIKTKQPGQ